MNSLTDNLRDAGYETTSVGSKVVVLTFGGRVIGLYPDGDTNVFWVNPQLESADSARAYRDGTGWLNTGGHRMWIAPEVDVNGNPNLWDQYDVPRTMDPGEYKITSQDDMSITLDASVNLRFQRSGKDLHLQVTKRINAQTDPPFTLPENVQCAGYKIQTRLASDAAVPDGVRPAIWDVIQVAGGGELHVPLKSADAPRDFINKAHYNISGNLLKCQYKTDKSFKFCIRAGNCTGKMLYLNKVGSLTSLIVCTFNVFDESLYPDYPADDPSDTGYVQEFYVDDGNLGNFGEMEKHSPGITEYEVADELKTWALLGAEVDILKVLQELLSD